MNELNQRLETYPKAEFFTSAPLVNNVFLSNRRAIFNEDWTLNQDGSQHFIVWDSHFRAPQHAARGLNFEQRCEEIASEARSKKIEELSDDFEYILCTHYHYGYPFGHWFETLAGLRLVEKERVKAIVHPASVFPGTNQLELHLELAGFSSDRVYTYEWRKTTPFIRRVYCPTVEEPIFGASREACNWLRSRYLNHPKVLAKLDRVPRKLYLSRNYWTHPNPDWTRGVLNEESEVLPFLEEKGFTIIRENLPLLELINLFYSATHIVFPHGSMMMNGLFCSNRPKVLEFISEYRLQDFNYKPLQRNDLCAEYIQVKSKADSPAKNNITIDLDVLKKFL